ncbi:MAG: LysR family transcriptional regulator [Peptococcaceae bacterium]|jgi:DNA-binding transcriptional LysR family regulator|nr:LysR family transcriptional regulator [Peptococcaceae bacterium]
MNLLQLRYFLVVARLENITHAAEEIHIAQPSLSKFITRLEESVGVPLFERRGNRIFLNQFGQAFQRRVERSLTELEEGEREIADLAKLTSQRVTLAASALQQYPLIFKEFMMLYPYVKFHFIQTTQNDEILKRLLKGELDFCITLVPFEHVDIHCKHLADEEIFLVVSKEHRFADRDTIELEEVADDPFVQLSNGSRLQDTSLAFCREAGFTPRNTAIHLEYPESTTIYGFVKAQFGNAFITQSFWDQINTASLVKLHIENPVCQRPLYISMAKEHYLSQTARDFYHFIVEYFSRECGLSND